MPAHKEARFYMAPIEVTVVSALRAVVEVALLALLGQGILALLAGSGRTGNIVYMLFRTVTSPVIKAVRFITPKLVIDKHLPFVAFFVLFWLWILLAWVKQRLCVIDGVTC
jgi:hypothetical protein